MYRMYHHPSASDVIRVAIVDAWEGEGEESNDMVEGRRALRGACGIGHQNDELLQYAHTVHRKLFCMFY